MFAMVASMLFDHPEGFFVLSISRSVLERFRTACRRAGLRKSRRAASPLVTLLGTAEGYRLQAFSRDLAIEYVVAGPGSDIVLRLPLEALDTCAGRNDESATFDVDIDGRVALSWLDYGVPRRSEHSQPPAGDESFPPSPATFAMNDACLWNALGDAVGCTDEQSSRYALCCLNLCGGTSRIEATDGRRALVQTGYHFGWEENVLVPGNKLLGYADIDPGETIEIGRTDDWVALRVGHWLIQLRIQKEARFPNIEQVIPNPEFARSRLELSAGDADFLKKAISRLPCDDAVHRPITLDLNGKVLVRSRELASTCPVEVDLRSSQLEGDPIMLNSDRRYLEHALRLGFRRIVFHAPNSPALAVDERRQFLWAVLDKGSAIPRHEDAQRIESPLAAVKISKRRRAAGVRLAA
jgi:hypothetical protein